MFGVIDRTEMLKTLLMTTPEVTEAYVPENWTQFDESIKLYVRYNTLPKLKEFQDKLTEIFNGNECKLYVFTAHDSSLVADKKLIYYRGIWKL